MNWDDLRFFLAVARTGSVRAASTRLGVNHSTVSRRLSSFEESAGVRLFDRSRDGYMLTSAGRDLLDSTGRIEEEVASLDRRIFGMDQSLQGSLRVTVSQVLASNLLMDDIAIFCDEHPEVDLNLLDNFEHLDLGKRQADVAIRITRNPPETLVGRRVGEYGLAIYQPKALKLKAEPPFWLEAGTGEPPPEWLNNQNLPSGMPRRLVHSSVLRAAAMRAGMGIGLLPCFLGDRDPELQRVPGTDIIKPFDLWVLTHADLKSVPRARAFTEFIYKALKRDGDLIAGGLGDTPESVE